MQTSTRRSARLLAAALCAGLLLLARPAAPGAAPARRFFAPAESATPTAKPPTRVRAGLRKLARKPGIRHILHPLGTVRSAAGKAKVKLARAIQNVQIARLERKLQKGTLGAEPSLDEVRHHSARVQRWRAGKSMHDEAHALLTDRVAVMSHHALETRLSKSDLLESASALEAKASAPEVLLPVGMEPTHVSHLISSAIGSVVGREIYGAPEGMKDVLENDLVEFGGRLTPRAPPRATHRHRLAHREPAPGVDDVWPRATRAPRAIRSARPTATARCRPATPTAPTTST
jgi:hypothetical protein